MNSNGKKKKDQIYHKCYEKNKKLDLIRNVMRDHFKSMK